MQTTNIITAAANVPAVFDNTVLSALNFTAWAEKQTPEILENTEDLYTAYAVTLKDVTVALGDLKISSKLIEILTEQFKKTLSGDTTAVIVQKLAKFMQKIEGKNLEFLTETGIDFTANFEEILAYDAEILQAISDNTGFLDGLDLADIVNLVDKLQSALDPENLEVALENLSDLDEKLPFLCTKVFTKIHENYGVNFYPWN